MLTYQMFFTMAPLYSNIALSILHRIPQFYVTMCGLHSHHFDLNRYIITANDELFFSSAWLPQLQLNDMSLPH